MNYYFNKVLSSLSFDEAIIRVTEELKKEGFGILTDIDVQQTLKNKLDVDFRRYRILGACNPPFAHKALLAEPKIGLMLPCNVVIEENKDGDVEISVINPLESMIAVDNDDLKQIAKEIKNKLEIVTGRL
ncbi:MAG: DUF302 domain-containing protein [Chlorobi bacterium]|nr:DUF302 domain-containing protein [Chlorobiota bacterium]